MLSLNDKPSKILKKIKILYQDYKISSNPKNKKNKINADSNKTNSMTLYVAPKSNHTSKKLLSMPNQNLDDINHEDIEAPHEVNKLIEIPTVKPKMETIEKDFVMPSFKIV